MKEEYIYKASPYLYREGMQLVEYNEKVNVSSEEMDTFLSKKLVRDIDMNILDVLMKYKVLNKHILEQYFSVFFTEYEGKDLKKNLKKLSDLGILKRYAYQYKRGKEETRTPFFYSPASGAYRYAKKFSKVGSIPDYKSYEITGENAYKMLAVNQFHVFFIKQNYSLIRRNYLHKVDSYGKLNEQIYIDAAFHLHTERLKKKTLDMLVVPVRNNKEWQDELNEYFAKLNAYLESPRPLISSPFIIILAESDNHIKDIHKYMKKLKIDLNGNILLYTTDLIVARENICDYLMQCDEDEEGNVRIQIKKLSL